MAGEQEPYEPLWATGLARSPQPREAEPPPPPAPAPRFPARLAVAAAVLVVAALLGAASVGTRPAAVTIGDEPSAWGDIAMTCATVRLEDSDRTVEFFRCRALGNGALPPGTYDAPDTLWRSDVDRRPALDHTLRISPSGVLAGVALYVP